MSQLILIKDEISMKKTIILSIIFLSLIAFCGVIAIKAYSSNRGNIGTLKNLAAKGDPKAEYDLGKLYYYGKGVPKSYFKAAYWAKKSAAQGNAKAEYALGVLYFYGQGVPKNYSKVTYWWKKSCQHRIKIP